jgi:hypothetical protein
MNKIVAACGWKLAKRLSYQSLAAVSILKRKAQMAWAFQEVK